MKVIPKSQFGKLSKAYSIARQEYPTEVINSIVSLIPKEAKVLDVGCGTGIATRQLAQNSFQVFACDMDRRMIKEAKKDQLKNITYYVAETNNLPFENETFDMVTVFGAYHWFCDEKSTQEIKRVMKKDSFFCVVNKNDVGNFKKDFLVIVSQFVDKKLTSVKDFYDPIVILKEHRFKNVKANKILTAEYFTFEKALLQFQSMDIWNNFPIKLKLKVLKALRNHFKLLLIDGLIKRDIKITTVVGKN